MNKKKKQQKSKLLTIFNENIVPAVLGGLALFVVFYNMSITPANVALFSSLGATTVILSSFPSKHMAKLRVVVMSYFIAALFGYVASYISYVPIAAAVGVSFTIAVMLITDNAHPPAAGITLSFIFSSAGFFEVFYVLVFIIMLILLLKFVVHLYVKTDHIKKFKHEIG